MIITNADEDWVRFSSQQFLPRIVELLLQNLRVVSARRYEHLRRQRSLRVLEGGRQLRHECRVGGVLPRRGPGGRARPRDGVHRGFDLARNHTRRRLAPWTPICAIKLVAGPGASGGCQLVAVTAALPFLARRRRRARRGGGAGATWARRARTTPGRATARRVWSDAAWAAPDADPPGREPGARRRWDAGRASVLPDDVDHRPSLLCARCVFA